MMKDRIKYMPEEFKTKWDEPIIDEVVMQNASVHLECLNDSCYMLILENKKHHWHLTIQAHNGKAHVEARLYEEFSP